jgi:tripartite-type tricarboxylate transporter receptor subunit TctC
MKIIIKTSLSLLLSIGILVLGSNRVIAQNYPDKTITVIVSFTPGSANDILVRTITPDLSKLLNQSIIVENKPGAGGSIGTGLVAKAPGDGYTIGLGSTATLAINPALFKKVNYNSLKDFKGVAYLASTPNILVVPASSPAKNINDLVELMKKKRLNYSSPGNGTTQHLTGVLFVNQVGSPAEHIPFKGPAEAIVALASGEVDYGFASLASAIPQIKAGRIRGLAITSSNQIADLPNVPTMDSFGYKGFEKTAVWFGLVVPSSTPDSIVQIIHQNTMKVLQNTEVRKKLITAGYDPASPMPASTFQSLINEQVVFWRELVAVSGASID